MSTSIDQKPPINTSSQQLHEPITTVVKTGDEATQSDNGANAKKKQPPVTKESPVSFRQLFRYVDRTDYLILFFGVCASLAHGICFALYLMFFGRLTGIFAIQSFPDHCHNAQQKLSIIHNDPCPLSINRNSFNSLYWNKFCGNTTNPLSPSLRLDIMSQIYSLLVITTIQLISASLRHFLFESTARRQTSRMRVRLFQAILHRNISYFDEHPIGQLNAKLFDNIDKINTAIGFDLSTMIQLVMSAIAIIVIGFSIRWKLTLIMICLIPIVVVIMRLFAKFTTKEAVKEFMAYAKAGQIVQTVFSSLRTVLSLNGAQFEQKRYAKELEGSHWNSVRKGIALGLLIGWLFFTTYLIYASGFLFGLLLMYYEEGDRSMISDILVIAISFGQCISMIGLIGPFLQTCAEAQAAAMPVFRLIDEAEGPDAIQTERWTINDEGKKPVDLNGDIRFDNVNFIYPSRQDVVALRKLTLVAHAGETTALVGPSGSGKSTCMSLLLRYYEPSSGRITIDERSLTDYNVRDLRKHIGIISQEPILFGTSIYENIRYGKENASQEEIEEAARQANAHSFIMRLPNRYETLVGESGVQLSGGEKQRIALARALVKQPTLLLMDEATSALDNSSEKIVQEALDRACQGRTTIVIAHRLSTIRNAHRIYVFANGTIVEQGSHDTLMAQEGSKYQEMMRAQTIEGLENDNNGQDVNRVQLNGDDNEQQSLESTLLLPKDHTEPVDQRSASKGQSTFFRLLAMNKPEWRVILGGCLICIAVGITQPLFAILLTLIVNAFGSCTYEERREQVLKFSFLFLLLGLVSVVLRFFQFGAFALSGSQLSKRVRIKAFESLLRQEVGFFDRPENSSGAISTRLSSDAMAVQQMVGTRLGIIFETVAMLSFGLVIGYLFNWKLASLFLAFIILVFFLICLEIRLQTQVNKRKDLILSRSSSLAVEAIHNIRVVKQFVLEKEFLRQYVELIHQSYLICRTYSAITAVIFGVYWSSILFHTTAIYSLVLLLVERKELEFYDVIKVFIFATLFSQLARVISSLSKEIGASVAAAQNFFNLFDRIPAIDNGSNSGEELSDFHDEIQFDLIKFAYPSRPTSYVFDKFQLTIKSGQRVAIVGASGCGKSTIVQLLERFYDVTDGQLLIDGVDIRRLNLHCLRSRLGLVSQEPQLFDLTISENISYGLDNISYEEIIVAAKKANIHEFIQTLSHGYDTKVGPKGSQLSGGEKQRIAIARILVRRPKILLLDEATSAMDSYNEQIVQEALDQAQMEDPTRTSIIIAHRLSTIRSCDCILVLNKGYLVESGTHTELIQRRGLYYQMLVDNI